MMVNVQYITLKEHYHALVSLLKYSVSTITLELWSKSLIPKEVHDSIILTTTGEPVIKAARLVSCITDRVQHGSPDSEAFYDFLDVLDQDPYFSDIVEKIRKSCALREAKMLKIDVVSMQERLQSEIETNNEVSPLELVNELTLLPESVQEEYQRFVSRELGTLDRGEAFEALFCHLKPYFTFLDYRVLECLINHYGSAKLKEDMSAYHRRVRIFKERTTTQQVIGHEWLGQHDMPSHFLVLIVKIVDFVHYTLSQVDRLKQRLCAILHSAESECCLSLSRVTMDGVYWTFPSLLCSNFPPVIELNGPSDDPDEDGGGVDCTLPSLLCSNFPSVIELKVSSGDRDKDGGWGAFDDDKEDNDQRGASSRSRKRRNEAENKGDTKRQKQDHGKQVNEMLLKMVDLFELALLPSRKEKQLHQLQRGKLFHG